MSKIQDTLEQRCLAAFHFWSAVLPPCMDICLQSRVPLTLYQAYRKFALAATTSGSMSSLVKHMNSLSPHTPLGGLTHADITDLIKNMRQTRHMFIGADTPSATVTTDTEMLLTWMIHSPYRMWRVHDAYKIQQELYQLMYPKSPYVLAAMRLNDMKHGVNAAHQTHWLIDRWTIGHEAPHNLTGSSLVLYYWALAVVSWYEARIVNQCIARALTAKRLARAASLCVVPGTSNVRQHVHSCLQKIAWLLLHDASWHVVKHAHSGVLHELAELLVGDHKSRANMLVMKRLQQLVGSIFAICTSRSYNLFESISEHLASEIDALSEAVKNSGRMRPSKNTSKLPQRALRAIIPWHSTEHAAIEGLIPKSEGGIPQATQQLLMSLMHQSQLMMRTPTSFPILPKETFEHWMDRCRSAARGTVGSAVPGWFFKANMARSLWTEDNRTDARMAATRECLVIWARGMFEPPWRSPDQVWHDLSIAQRAMQDGVLLQHIKELCIEMLYESLHSHGSVSAGLWVACQPRGSTVLQLMVSPLIARPQHGRRCKNNKNCETFVHC